MGNCCTWIFAAVRNCCGKRKSAGEPLITMPQSDSPHVHIGPKEQESEKEGTSATKDGRDPAKHEDPAEDTTQESDTRVSSPAITTQPLPSASEVSGQDDCTDHSSEKGAIDAYSESNGGNGHVGEEDSGVGLVGDAKDEARPTPLSPTSSAPGVEEGSLDTEDQPHPTKAAKIHSETDVASVTPVRDFVAFRHAGY